MTRVIILISLMLFAGCSVDMEQPIEEVNISSTKSFKVSEEEAVQRLEKMLTVFEPTTRVQKRIVKEIIPHIKHQTRSLVTDISDTLMYIVNFDNEQGYAVVSADNRIKDFVLALIDTGNYIPTSNNASMDPSLYSDLYELLDDDEKDDFWCSRTDPSTLTIPSIGMIEDYLMSEMNNNLKFQKTTIDTVLIKQVGPYLKTKWGQREPYNAMCHACLDGYFHIDATMNNYRTGCIATALAQILAYHKYPVSAYEHTYNWDVLHQKEKFDTTVYDTPAIAYEIAHLMRATGLASDMNYGKNGSSSTANKAKKALANTFGYSNVTRKLYFASSSIVKTIDSGALALVTGLKHGKFVGHAWVIDGYRKYKFATITTTYTNDTYTDVKSTEVAEEEVNYYHCNYGWNGTANGYYLGKIFNTAKGPEFTEDTTPYTTSSNNSYNYTWWFRTVLYDNPNK